jgi:hypothetical protein
MGKAGFMYFWAFDHIEHLLGCHISELFFVENNMRSHQITPTLDAVRNSELLMGNIRRLG